ncbi:MAG: enoyl-CoA hydratase family protein [Planctomycetota bacterium]
MEIRKASDVKPEHFKLEIVQQGGGGVAFVTLDRPDRKNPLTFESYAELRDFFDGLRHVDDVDVVVLTGAGENFCSGGDVHDIIGPLTEMDTTGLVRFTRMTGDLVKAMRLCPQPIVAAIDGICVGAGAILAMASDLRYGTERTKVGFLFTKVGLSGADMGACAMLPRIIGQGRASELLYTGRMMSGEEGERWGFFNQLLAPEDVLATATQMASRLASGPHFAHAITKSCLHHEWAMGIEAAIEHEAQAQAVCMHTKDFERAFQAFVRKERPQFEGD